MLVEFAWCLAQADRDPKTFHPERLLWPYKWVVENSVNFPQVARTRLLDLSKDMERRYKAAGASMHSVELKRRSQMVQMGEKKAAQEAHAKFRKCRRDFLSDCPACVADNNCTYQSFLGRWSRAMAAAKPVLEGDLHCLEQPHLILGSVLLPLLHLRRLDEAKQYQRRGYRLVTRGAQFLLTQSHHLRFQVIIGEMASAKRLLERHLPTAIESVVPSDRFAFLLAAKLWCDKVTTTGTRKLKLQLPKELPSPGEDGKVDLHAFGDWISAKASEIAKQFDGRNGNSHFSDQLARLPELLTLAP